MKPMIRDQALAMQGAQKIEWARRHMTVLSGIAEDMRREQPLRGLKVALSIHLEAKTAYLAQVLHQGGAEVCATGSNPLSTQDDVCAALAQSGVTVYAAHACTAEEYH
ncbi:MAG: adenosylhomocysteinase, partial [Clostridia bacterium]